MAKAYVDEIFAKNKKVVMFSKSTCPFCEKAKKVFEKLIKEGTLSTDDYEVVEIDGDPKCSDIQDLMQKMTGGRSVPRVFVKGKFIGGGDDVVAMGKSGKLVPLLTA
ncbi:hypothetical protein ACOMHN_001137 [Nucella lapillus]